MPWAYGVLTSPVAPGGDRRRVVPSMRRTMALPCCLYRERNLRRNISRSSRECDISIRDDGAFVNAQATPSLLVFAFAPLVVAFVGIPMFSEMG